MDGIEFIADKYAGGGSLNNTVDSVLGGTVYQSERYGALKYEIPVTANGSYTVKLHFAEIYQTAADARSFSVAIEGNPVITGLDLFAEVGHDVGYTETFENIAVSDGGVSIELIAGTENPTIAGFEIYSGDGELDTSVVYEPAKDFSKFSAYQGRYEEATTINARHATGHVGDFFFTHWQDRGTTTMDLETNGEFQVNWTSDTGNYVGGPGWHYGDENRVIGTRIDSDSGASFFTIYGWGYNKDQNRSDPYHLVEYYILLRGTYNVLGNPGATRGITFTSNGVEYQTVRSDRNGQASINSTSTFKQYWSIPSQQAGIGETREIIFADHVNAWAENGWPMPDMNNIDASDDPTYQVLAAEVFGINSNGSASGRVWDATP
ncbi:MAG TPA: glycoside hydrolase family 11 protein [Marinagarivorans sp.]